MKNTKYIPFKTIVTAALLFVAVACKNEQSSFQGPPPVPVAVQVVTTSDVVYYEEYPALVKALNEVELRAQVNGYITGIYFNEGDQVKKGQKLYSIDQQQSEAAYNQALANLAVQEANYERAKKDVERYRALDRKDATTKQQVDYAETAYTTAAKQVEAAKATVQSVQTNVRYATIIAPFTGTIGISQVKLGASVSPGQTLLNTVSSDDPMAVDIVIDQNDIFKFNELLVAKNKSVKNDSTFRLAFRDVVHPYVGKISFIDRAVDPQTGTIKVRIEFPNPEHTLRAGMSGKLQLLTASDNTILIPHKAITEQLGEFFVYMPDSLNATQRKVKLGKQVGKNIIITDGLAAGETLIVEGIQNLREGSAITIPDGQKNN